MALNPNISLAEQNDPQRSCKAVAVYSIDAPLVIFLLMMDNKISLINDFVLSFGANKSLKSSLTKSFGRPSLQN